MASNLNAMISVFTFERQRDHQPADAAELEAPSSWAPLAVLTVANDGARRTALLYLREGRAALVVADVGIAVAEVVTPVDRLQFGWLPTRHARGDVWLHISF